MSRETAEGPEKIYNEATELTKTNEGRLLNN